MLNRRLFVALMALALTLFIGRSVLAEEEKTHDGKIVRAGNGELVMTDKDGNNRMTHKVASDAKIMLDNKEVKLDDLKEGMNVKVTAKNDADKTATKIEAKTKD